MEVLTCYSETDQNAFRRMVQRSKADWEFLVAGEWSQSPYHAGNANFSIRCSSDRRFWALMYSGFPKRIIAAASASGDEETEFVAAEMMSACKAAGGAYIDSAHEW